MEAKIIRENHDFQGLEKNWDSALAKSNINNVFLEFDWLYSWWQHLSNGSRLFIIIVHEDNEISGIAPLMLSKNNGFRQLSFISGPLADYEDIITTGDAEKREKIIGLIIDRIHNSKEWDVFKLKGLRRNSTNFVPLRNICLRKNKSVISFKPHKDGAPYLTITEEWDRYCSKLKKSFIADTKRQVSRLAKQYDLNFLEATALADIPVLLDKLMEFHIARHRALKSRSIFEDPAVVRFFKTISSDFFDKGYLSLNYLKVKDEIAAIHLGFRKDNKLYYYIPVFSEQFRPYSIGRLLLFDLMRKSFENRITEFDFMLGEEDYKMDWSPDVESLYFLNMFPRTIQGYMAYLRFDKFNIGVKKLLGKKW